MNSVNISSAARQHYPETGEWILRPTRGRDEIRLRRR